MSRLAENVVERSVRERYAAAAEQRDSACCATPERYDPNLLANVPREVVEVDLGCGNPTRWIKPGETVLDLGSGSGKVCYVAAQIVGPTGRVIGVDFNLPMLAIARKHQAEFARRVGYDNLSFRKGRIQDLALDIESMEHWLREHPARASEDYLAIEEQAAVYRAQETMIKDESIDCIVSNCVLNLVQPGAKRQLFCEMYRVLKYGGRCVISDIVSDKDIPESLRRDPQLWSECASGAFRQDKFLAAFAEAEFCDIEIIERAAEPWRVVEGVEFRSVTVRAFKPTGRCA